MTIDSTGNQHVRAARKLATRKGRSHRGAFLVEGPNLVTEAGPHLFEVFVSAEASSDVREVSAAAERTGAREHVVSPTVLASLATTVTPQGIVGVATLDEPSLAAALMDARLVLLCCDVADPGNAGTVIRTADAAGADAVLFTAGSVDSRNPKAVRASAGSLFHLPVLDDIDAHEALAQGRTQGLHLVAAAADGAVTSADIDLSVPTMIVLGGEAHGLPHGIRDACDSVVRVPMTRHERPGWHGVAESLNLASTAAVLCFEAARQRGTS